MIDRITKTFASLRLTVICLGFSFVLVFLGTLAQVEYGLYQAQAIYFRSFVVWWTPGDSGVSIPILPGGYLLGAVLLANLIVAHLTRFRISRKKIGILMIHSGLILLLMGQFFTDVLSEEGTMTLRRGQTSNYAEDLREHELVIRNGTRQEWAISQSALDDQGEIRDERLPVTIRVNGFWPHADLTARHSEGAIPVSANLGVGSNGVFLQPLPLPTSIDSRRIPAAVIELISPTGSLGTWIVSSLVREPQHFRYQDDEYEIAMRVKRHYKPYSITLIDLRHDVYVGTEIPRNFSSRVRIRNPETGEDREVLISMNNPLRYQGDTYYQYQMEKASDVSVLQVVHNPSWLTPYISCILVGLGLVVQFMTHLIGSVRRRIA